MKPSELLARIPESEDHSLFYLISCYYSHVLESGIEFGFDMSLPSEDPNKRIRNKVFKHFNFDHRRYWRLAAIYFDDSPVMITQNAGREGDDHHERIILDKLNLRLMCDYLRTISKSHENQYEKLVEAPLEEDIPNLTKCYNDELDGYFRRHSY